MLRCSGGLCLISQDYDKLAERAEIRTGNPLRNKPRALLCAGTELAANRDELCRAATAVSGKLRHLIACGHHEGGFAGLIHAAEPTCVERRTAFLLFLEGILPDLHRLAAAWARITVTRDDDAQLSYPLPLQIAPASAPHILTHKNTNARRTRALARPSNLKIKNQNSGGT